MKVISVLDRDTKTYYMFGDPSEVTELVGSKDVPELNRRYELAIDGHIINWPHTDPHLIEQYIHEFMYDKGIRLPN